MAESDATDQDKKRIRTQFTKNERFHLLKIMEEYGSLLEDKNLSVLARKEIWLRVENNFNSGQFLGRTSAQLKKYWQNYKYHSKKTKLLQKVRLSFLFHSHKLNLKFKVYNLLEFLKLSSIHYFLSLCISKFYDFINFLIF